MQKNFNPREIKFNKTTSSHDFNEMNQELGLDLYEIHKNLTQQKTKLKEVMNNLKLNNYGLLSKINELKEIKRSLPGKQEFISCYNKDNISFGEDIAMNKIQNKCFYSFNYGIATLGFKNRNIKTFLKTIEGNILVPDDLSVEIIDNNEDAIVEETPIKNAFDQKISTAWLRTYQYPHDSSTEKVTVQMIVKIPRTIVTDMFVNSIYLDLIPERSVNIENIEYKPLNSGGFEPLDSFDIIENASPQLITFPEKQMTEIRFTLSQTENFKAGDDEKKVFPIGIKNCTISHDIYEDESEIVARFTPRQDTKIISSVRPVFKNKVSPNSYEVEVYGVNTNDEGSLKEIKIGEPITFNYNEDFYIKVKLKKDFAISTPVMEGVLVNYGPFEELVTTNEISNIEVDYNTSGQEVIEELPETINGTLTNEAEVTVDIEWHIPQNYNRNNPRDYIFRGHLRMQEDEEVEYFIPHDLSTIETRVTLLQPIQLVSIDEVEGFSVMYETTANEVIDQLPDTISGELETNETVNLDVEWETPYGYSNVNPGDYIFKGSLSRQSEDTYYSIPYNLSQTEVTVTLLEEVYIESVESINDEYSFMIETTMEQVINGLPDTLTADLSDGSTENLNINWSSSDFNGDEEGNYTFTGTVSSTIVNVPSEYKTLEITVIIQEGPELTSVDTGYRDIYVKEGASSSSATRDLPRSTTGSLDNGETASLSISWSAPSDYDGSVGNYSFIGTFSNSDINIPPELSTWEKTVRVVPERNEPVNVLKAVNSWGNSYSDYYITYEAMKTARARCYIIEPRGTYNPQALALFKISGHNRGSWSMKVKTDTNKEKSFYTSNVSNKGGSHSFPNNELVIDITELMPFDEEIMLEVQNNSSSNGTIDSFEIQVGGQTYTCSDVPKSVSAGSSETVSVGEVSASADTVEPLDSAKEIPPQGQLEKLSHTPTLKECKELAEAEDEIKDNCICEVDGKKFGTGDKPMTEEDWLKARENGNIKIIDSEKVLAEKESDSDKLEIHCEKETVDGNNYVDHSESSHFPPIRSQGSKGSCASWATVYYPLTYYEAKAHGWNASSGNNNYILSPDSIYNLINDGQNQGTHGSDNSCMAAHLGACTWSSMPYNDSDATSWPSKSAFIEATKHRAEHNLSGAGPSTSLSNHMYYIRCTSDSDIETLKTLLDNGYLIYFSMDAEYYSELSNNNNIFARYNYFVWDITNQSRERPHANTIVGYYE